MNRPEAVERLERLADDMQRDVDTAQTRELHLALSLRLGEVRRIAGELRAG